MKCKPEIWEAVRGPDEYGRQPWCAAESSMLMLLARRSVHFASPLLSLSALHNVSNVKGMVLKQLITLECDISPRMNRVRNGSQLVCSCVGMIADLLPLTGFLYVKVCPLESVAALFGLHLASFLFSSSVFINSPFVAPALRSHPVLLTYSHSSS